MSTPALEGAAAPSDEEENRRHKELNRGLAAQRIFEEEVFKDAVESVRDRIYGEFAASADGDDATRKTAKLKLTALNDVLAQLRTHVETGRLAQEQLSAWSAIKERFKRKAA